MAIQLKIQIKNITKPPVWRRLLIPDSFNFRQLHYAIQIAFDWTTSHLYQFQKQAYDSGWCIGEPSPDDEILFFDTPTTPAQTVNVRRFLEKNHLDKFVYVYDFGDDWIHQITLEELTDEVLELPRCLAGKGCPPPEDCGGPYGFEELKLFLEKHDRSEEEAGRLEWFGLIDEEGNIEFDARHFDLDEINMQFCDFNALAKEMDKQS